jgi:hypothetical protein
MENYLSFLINIVTLSLKRDIPIETSYSIIYTKDRKNEREAMNLAGYDVSYFKIINFDRAYTLLWLANLYSTSIWIQ